MPISAITSNFSSFQAAPVAQQGHQTEEQPAPDQKIARLKAQISQLTSKGETEETIEQQLRLENGHITCEAQATGKSIDIARLRLIRRALVYRTLKIQASVDIEGRISAFGRAAVKATENILKHFALRTTPKRYAQDYKKMPTCVRIQYPTGTILVDSHGACTLKGGSTTAKKQISTMGSYFNPNQIPNARIMGVTYHEGFAKYARRELSFLEKCQGPGVVQLLGKTDPGEHGLPTYFLQRHDLTLFDLIQFGSMQKISVNIQAIYALLSVTDALIRMEKMGIIHRDLKPQHILIDKEGNGRLIGFDSSVQIGQNDPFEHEPRGAYEYAPPEVYLRGEKSDRYDVWSFGMLLCKILGVQHPLVKYITPKSIPDKLLQALTEDGRRSYESKFKEPAPEKDPFGYLIYWCTRLDPKDRLSLEEVKLFLEWAYNMFSNPDSINRKENIPPPVPTSKKKPDLLSKEVAIAG